MGGRPCRVSKNHAVCMHLELQGQAETKEQKVGKPVLSLLSSTLPPPREEAEETGGGAGCYRAPIGGTRDRHWGAFSYSPPVWSSTEERETPRVTHLRLEKKSKGNND